MHLLYSGWDITIKSDFDLEVLSILYVYHTSIRDSIELMISFEIAKNSTHISECSFFVAVFLGYSKYWMRVYGFVVFNVQ